MAGYCLGLLPQASDYGGANRPPVALFATASPVGLKVTMSLEGRHESLASQEAATLGFPGQHGPKVTRKRHFWEARSLERHDVSTIFSRF